MSEPENTPTQLYMISPPAIELASFVQQLEEALIAGAESAVIGAFQLRLKEADDAQVMEAARACMPLCNDHGVAFILNDRPDLVVELGADGVHLGQEDLDIWPLEKVRSMFSEDMAIGISCHASTHMAMDAGDRGADYVAFGAFHPTKSKPMEKLEKYGMPECEILEWWSTYTVIPSVAIGGMTPENCTPMVEAGVDFIAAINSIWAHEYGAAAAVKAFEKVLL